MAVLLIALQPVTLALTVGLVDLFLSEFLKFSRKSSTSWRRRLTLYRQSRYIVSGKKYPFSTVFISQIILLGLGIWLELSISPAIFPSTELIDERCFKTDRPTKIIDKGGPNQDELKDERIQTYVQQTQCGDRLLKLALAGQTAIIRGYPPCESNYEIQNISENLILQGSSIAHVANAGDGDPQLTYGLMAKNGSVIAEDHGAEGAKSLATTSFWAIHLASYERSTSFWKFEDSDDRIISNANIPGDIISNAPNSTDFPDESRGEIECPDNDLDCYHEYAAIAHQLKPINQPFIEKNAALLIRSHKSSGGNVPSYICILDKGDIKLTVSWVYMKQSIGGESRNRSGQAITSMSITGNNAKCVWNTSRLTSRLYHDAMENIELKTSLEQPLHKDPLLSLFERVRLIAVKAAVLMGMKTLDEEDDSNKCRVYNVQNGSSIGKLEMIVSGIYITLICGIIVWDVLVIAYKRLECPMFVDPLNTMELLEQLRVAQDQDRPRGASSPNQENYSNVDHAFETQGTEQGRQENMRRLDRIMIKLMKIWGRDQSNDFTNRNPNAVLRNASNTEPYIVTMQRQLHSYHLQITKS